MKNLFRLLAVLFCLFAINNLYAQWIQTNGPYGGSGVTVIAISGDNLFAGTDNNGIFRSSENGLNWTAVNSGLPAKAWISALAVKGTVLFAGTTGEGVFRSENNGTSWIAINQGLTNIYVRTLAVMDANLFAGTDAGVFRSGDNGASWTPAGLPESSIHTLSVSGENLFAGAWLGIFHSSDRGVSWSRADSGLVRTDDYDLITAFAVRGETLFAVKSNQYGELNDACGLFCSSDYGASWRQTSMINTDVQRLFISDTTLFISIFKPPSIDEHFGYSFLRSVDNGTSWTKVGNGLAGYYITAFTKMGTNFFAGTIDGLIFRSPENGESWSATGLPNSEVNLLAVNGTNLFASEWQRSGLSLSRDDGTSWIPINNGLAYWINTLSMSDSILFAGTSNGIFWSGDTGNTWIASNTGLTCDDVRALVISGTDIFAGSMDDYHRDGGVFRSTDNGTSWTPTGLMNAQVSALALRGDFLFAGTWWGDGIFRSGDQGATWTPSGLAGKDISVFAGVDGFLFAGTYTSGVFCTSDNGVNWTATNNGLTNPVIYDLAVSGANLFAATYRGVFLSRDNGAHWTGVNDGLANMQIRSLAVNNENLFAGSWGSGVWRRSLPEMIATVSGPGGSTGLPTHFNLEQNYPNPFNPATTIEFALPKAAFVTLKIYNLRGQEITALVAEKLPAGMHQITWDATRLASGVYFCRLEANDPSTSSGRRFVQVIKLALVK